MELQIILVFFLGFCIDLFYVLYVNAVRDKAKIKAGVASVLLAAPALFGFMSILEDRWLMIPYFLGLFIGTVTAITWEECDQVVSPNTVVHSINRCSHCKHSCGDNTN